MDVALQSLRFMKAVASHGFRDSFGIDFAETLRRHSSNLVSLGQGFMSLDYDLP